jgi:hypothetical protein
LARTSAEYALLGRKVWAAFECAALAGIAGDADQQKRLFTLGYEQGKTFIEAQRSGKIERQDLTREVPVGLLGLDTPSATSADFVLGRVWEAVLEEARKIAYDSESNPNGDEGLAAWLALQHFRNKNCSLM